ncbi:Nn.00g088190.m01.CDS01 [Neocucurbitaria sp. VM-36]
MDNLSFLDELTDYGSSNATLKAVLPDGHVWHISDRICPYKFLDACPLLYHAFEYGFQSRLQASIEAPSRSAVVSLIRYCYTRNYLSAEVEDSPVLLLLQHAEVYKMAEDFDVPELQLLAHGNFSCQIDYACSLPAPPQDLLETIRFIYQHYADYRPRQEHGLVNSLTNYCISNFFYHKLDANAEFLKIVSDIPAFRQDLCRTNIERNFQDDCAFEIIRLSLDTLQVRSGWCPTILASRDLPQEMLFDIPSDPRHGSSNDSTSTTMAALKDESCSSSSKTMNDAEESRSISTSTATTLVHRPRAPSVIKTSGFETDSSSDEEGFSLVHRPKVLACATPDEPMSSPELIPSAPIDILAATGSDYPSEEEWTMV